MVGWLTAEPLKYARMNAQGPWPLGGDPQQEVTDVAYVPIPGHVIVEIDGTALDQVGVVSGVRAEVHATAYVAAGTGSIRLWDITAAAQVGAAQAFVNTTPDLVKIAGLGGLLAAAAHKYRLEVKGAAATDRPVVNGAVLVVK